MSALKGPPYEAYRGMRTLHCQFSTGNQPSLPRERSERFGYAFKVAS